MPVVDVSHVSKSFGAIKAVNDVSFTVEKGEIFGLLGPNGAGKTTIIRLMLDIFKPEKGQIAILGGPMSEAKKDRIGYMPEERGLYQDAQLERVLVYMATLKGVPQRLAIQRIRQSIDRFELSAYRKKKVKDLSKGMQQKAQLIATLAHQPELIIIDEPFSALDPINTQNVKELLRELRQQGATIIMSTHQMHQVEEMCDQILLINRGGSLLSGNLQEIRRQFSNIANLNNIIILQTAGPLPALSGVEKIETHNSTHRVTLAEGVTPQHILNTLVSQEVQVEKFQIALPTLEEIFVHVIKSDQVPE
ncbi:MAG: ATP-binding cassette domain-containing protein [Anaerolineales bacterium]|nr:ATP-binding cassette domain-containing protein [Anaerolineales bacterium]